MMQALVLVFLATVMLEVKLLAQQVGELLSQARSYVALLAPIFETLRWNLPAGGRSVRRDAAPAEGAVG